MTSDTITEIRIFLKFKERQLMSRLLPTSVVDLDILAEKTEDYTCELGAMASDLQFNNIHFRL